MANPNTTVGHRNTRSADAGEKKRESFMGYDLVFYDNRILVEPELPVQNVWAEGRGSEGAWYVNDGITNPTVVDQAQAVTIIRDAIQHYAPSKGAPVTFERPAEPEREEPLS